MKTSFLASVVLCASLAVSVTVSAGQTLQVPLPGKHSIVRLGAVPDPVTETGREIAGMLLEGLEQGSPAPVSDAIERLDRVVGRENVGGSYSAMRWLAQAWLAAKSKGIDQARPEPVMDRVYFDFFLNEDAANFKEYLQRKYAVGDFQVGDPEAHMDRRTFLEDMLMFNNPARSQWDATEQVVETVKTLEPPVKSVIDVGAGFGYFSQRFAEALGEGATVFAVDTQEAYVEALGRIVGQYGIGGVQPVLSTEDDVSVREPTDLVFVSSLYHVLYAWSQPTQRDAFMATLDKSLKPGGYLVILDNRDNAGASLHNSFLSRDFAVAQLYHYGFELVRSENLSPYRYLLVLRKAAPEAPKPPVYAVSEGQDRIAVSGSDSVVHIGSLDSFDITPSGIAAGKLLLEALTDADVEAARAAVDLYGKTIPTENFGGEYTALQWVAEYLAGSESDRKALTQDPLAAEFLAYLAADDYQLLKNYLARKYKLQASGLTVEEATDEKTREIGIVRRQALEDFILFNNPRRESWEKSSRILELLPLKAGDTIVDLGSGPGYFSFKFAERVGPEGVVYARDTKQMHIDYLSELAKKWDIENIRAAVSKTDGFEVDAPGTADVVFMCSLYHIIYAVSSQSQRDGMIEGIVKALRPGGKFVVVDNGPVDQGKLPYHGPYIRRELIRSQLEAYGFTYEWAQQIIPQRYLMVFSRGAGEAAAGAGTREGSGRR
ncbi:methyltransferase domain-containing protein [Thiorhodococcus minor]|uniref:Methyltransferase domain-containing protein n=1 Tax=Thiorhodococcus minor TaxID=57489 RepID=A0A6M0JY49_9GAMM|nr:methyltransferase domain-containing protein [Thiorhodococcus minor]NEV61035.1 methyltransferase domain-containing protein [Thiorhodococcus minor]